MRIERQRCRRREDRRSRVDQQVLLRPDGLGERLDVAEPRRGRHRRDVRLAGVDQQHAAHPREAPERAQGVGLERLHPDRRGRRDIAFGVELVGQPPDDVETEVGVARRVAELQADADGARRCARSRRGRSAARRASRSTGSLPPSLAFCGCAAGSGSRANSVSISASVKSSANQPSTGWPAMVLVALRPANSDREATSVVAASSAARRTISAPSLVATSVACRKSQPCAIASSNARAGVDDPLLGRAALGDDRRLPVVGESRERGRRAQPRRRGGERELAARQPVQAAALRRSSTSACRLELAAQIDPPASMSSPPSASVTMPPASLTSKTPAAMSQAPRSRSQNAS